MKGDVATEISGDFIIKAANSTILAQTKGSGNLKIKYKNLVYTKRIIANLPLKAILHTNNLIILPLNQNFKLNVIGGSDSY